MSPVRSSQPGRTRAEEARQRREQTSQTRVSRVTRNVVQPVRPGAQKPAVTVRGRAGTPVHQKTRGKVRRQFYYAVGDSGVEVRMPSVPLLRPSWRILSGFLSILLAFLVYLAYNDTRFQVDLVEYSGLKRIKPAMIEEMVSISGEPIFTIHPAKVSELVGVNFPELANIQVVTGLPNYVKISATERTPVLAWKWDEKEYWADGEGYLYPARGETPKILTISADSQPPVLLEALPLEATPTPEPSAPDELKKLEITGSHLDPKILRAARLLSKELPKDTTLIYSGVEGLGWVDTGGWKVFVGVNLDNIGMKLRVYAAIVDRLANDGITPAMISVENEHAPFYRTE